MKRRVQIILAACVLALVLVVVFLCVHRREPTYQGKTVREWLKEYPRLVSATTIDGKRIIDLSPVRTRNGAAGTTSVPPLTPVLISEDIFKREFIVTNEAARALSAMGPKAYPVLADILMEEDSVVKQKYRTLVAKFPKLLKKTLPVFPPPDLTLKLKAASVLADFAPLRTSLPILRFALQETNITVRSSVISTIGKLGTNAIEVVPDLISICREPATNQISKINQAQAVRALDMIAPKDRRVHELVMRCAADPNSSAYEASLMILTRQHPLNPESLRLLRASLKEKRFSLQTFIASILATQDAKNPETIEALRLYYTRTDQPAYTRSVYPIKKIASLDELLTQLKSTEAAKRYNALNDLRLSTAAPEKVTEILSGLLNDEHDMVRASAARNLGEMGAPAKPAIPALQALAADEKQPANVRRNAREAIEKITADTSPATKSP